MTGTALVPYVKPRDDSPAAIHVRTLWSSIKDFQEGLPLSEPRGSLPPHRVFTPRDAAGLQTLNREYAEATRLTLVPHAG